MVMRTKEETMLRIEFDPSKFPHDTSETYDAAVLRAIRQIPGVLDVTEYWGDD